MATLGNDLRLRLASENQSLQVLENATNAILAERTLDGLSEVNVVGTAQADKLTLDFSTLLPLTGPIAIDGAEPGDALKATGPTGQWC